MGYTDPKNKIWNKKQPRKSNTAKELSLAQRMTQARSVGSADTGEDGQPLSARQRMDVLHPSVAEPITPEAASPWAKNNAVAAPRKTRGGNIEDAGITAARQAMIDKGEAPRGYATPHTGTVPTLVKVDETTKRDLLFGFARRTREFEATKWNCEQLQRCLSWATDPIDGLKKPWVSSTFDFCFNYLKERGHLEFTYGQQKGAPIEFVPPSWKAKEEREQQELKAKLMQGKATIRRQVNIQAESEARAMDFDDLASSVRSGYRR